MAEYFALPEWGPDLQGAWEALSTLGPDFRCRVTNFAGEQMTIQLTWQLVREALHLQMGDVAFNDRAYKNEDRDLTSKVMEPRWDQLKCQAIQLPLQIHMQHLHVTNPHRWSLPEKAVAVQYTIRQMTQPKMRKDYMSTFLQKLLRASQSNVT